MQFTASQSLHDKLARLRALTRTQVPDGDLAAVVELAVDAHLAKLEAKRFGKTDKPRTSVDDVDVAARSRHIPAAIRREVASRVGNECTFVAKDGHQCTATHDLQFDHVEPYARGGDHSVDNLTLRCPAHNRYRAELDFGPYRARERRASYTQGRAPHPNPPPRGGREPGTVASMWRRIA